MLDQPEQLAVIHGLRLGDSHAWSALYDGYSADIWRYVARLVGPDTAIIADIVQETFLGAARTARQFNPERGTLWAWLTGIAHHQTSLHWRQIGKVQRLKELVDARADEIRHWLDKTESIDQPWLRDELADAVRAALAGLPSDYSTLLTAKYIDDRSLDELSRELGGTVEAVKSRLARARREFRARMEAYIKEPAQPSDTRTRRQ